MRFDTMTRDEQENEFVMYVEDCCRDGIDPTRDGFAADMLVGVGASGIDHVRSKAHQYWDENLDRVDDIVWKMGAFCAREAHADRMARRAESGFAE